MPGNVRELLIGLAWVVLTILVPWVVTTRMNRQRDEKERAHEIRMKSLERKIEDGTRLARLVQEDERKILLLFGPWIGSHSANMEARAINLADSAHWDSNLGTNVADAAATLASLKHNVASDTALRDAACAVTEVVRDHYEKALKLAAESHARPAVYPEHPDTPYRRAGALVRAWTVDERPMKRFQDAEGRWQEAYRAYKERHLALGVVDADA